MNATLFSFLIIVFLILINGLFVAAEFAIIGVRASRMEELVQAGNRTAIGIRDTVRAPARQDRYIATAQLGITLASLGLGMIGEPAIAHLIEGPLHDWFGLEGAIVHTISFIVALSLMTYLHIVFGEMIPKSLALQSAERVVLALAVPMRLIGTILSPAITVLNKLGVFIMHLLRIPPPKSGSRLHTADELEMIVSESVAGGLLDSEEQQLIANIFDFADRRVGQVMTPRPRIAAVPVTVSEEALLDLFKSSPHSRVPFYEGTIDNVIGILHLKDFVRQQLSGQPYNPRALLRKAPIVPETLFVESLLASMKRSHQHMAIVIDEYGGTAGLVTLEDLVEEVVGEVRDEFDHHEHQPIQEVAPGHWVVQGTVLLEDVEDEIPLGTVEHDVETIGGLVLAELNRPPQVGDEVEVNGVRLRVETVDGLAIEEVDITVTPTDATP